MISFMRLKWFSLIGSTVLVVAMFAYTELRFGGMKKGIDFAGGIKLEISLNDQLSIDQLRAFFESEKIDATVQKADKENQNLAKIEIGGEQESSLRAQMASQSAAMAASGYAENPVDYLKFRMVEKLGNGDSTAIEFIGASQVGPTVGAYLRKSAVKLLLVVIVLITIYVAFRFRLNFAMDALLATLHDLTTTIAFIGILQIPLSIPVVAAILTILGYSINDTIVIFDRIRENMKSAGDHIEKVVDISINESITRTINTSLTTMISIIGVYLLGGDSLRDMALVLLIGIGIGTYSSSFIASPIVVLWDRFISSRLVKR